MVSKSCHSVHPLSTPSDHWLVAFDCNTGSKLQHFSLSCWNLEIHSTTKRQKTIFLLGRHHVTPWNGILVKGGRRFKGMEWQDTDRFISTLNWKLLVNISACNSTQSQNILKSKYTNYIICTCEKHHSRFLCYCLQTACTRFMKTGSNGKGDAKSTCTTKVPSEFVFFHLQSW